MLIDHNLYNFKKDESEENSGNDSNSENEIVKEKFVPNREHENFNETDDLIENLTLENKLKIFDELIDYLKDGIFYYKLDLDFYIILFNIHIFYSFFICFSIYIIFEKKKLFIY